MVDGALAAWDTAALFPTITEAGGVFTDWHGRSSAFGGSAIATNAALAVQVRALLDADSTAHDGGEA
jgi:fructose-1,6-bisphosphatase/inositol monophosphatase family enzyme